MPIYWAFLTYILLRPSISRSDQWFIFVGIDKLIHAGVFFLFSLIFLLAFPKIRYSIFIQIGLSYALITEILQDEMGLGRSLEVLDLLADSLGIIIGYYVFSRYFKTH